MLKSTVFTISTRGEWSAETSGVFKGLGAFSLIKSAPDSNDSSTIVHRYSFSYHDEIDFGIAGKRLTMDRDVIGWSFSESEVKSMTV